MRLPGRDAGLPASGRSAEVPCRAARPGEGGQGPDPCATLASKCRWLPDREGMTNDGVSEPTLASTWRAMADRPITADLLEWPPDVFALTNVILARSEAFRFVLSPVGDWPPARTPDWEGAVGQAARSWGAWTEDHQGEIPALVTEEWRVLSERAGLPMDQLARGRDWRLCQALLTLHAIADEACAGLGVALDTSDATACVYRARGRELLARNGSIARIDPRWLRVLPKVRTPPTGRAAFSRYACVQGPGIEARWHKMPARHRGTDLSSEYATLLLLPWPLRVRTSDFRPIEGSVRRQAQEPYGFFEFAPRDGLDFDLLERVLAAAREEAGSVDVVYLPESAVDEDEIGELEAVLQRHGVVFLQTGVREHSPSAGRLPGSSIHMGISSVLQKGDPGTSTDGSPWFHIRQHKHHRWSLDSSQIEQYHLGGVLHPHVRWWEAIEVPRQEIQFVEVAELTFACLVCEDLAQNDTVAELIRAVGPTIVFPALLDGPQLTSRWASRYASVLADDPGSAVLTLTSFGMVQRSRPRGNDASSVIALWKDPATGIREIPLEAGAQAVLLTVCMDRAGRRSADGRSPVSNGTQCFDAAVHQIRVPSGGPPEQRSLATRSAAHLLDSEELTVLTAWAEAVSEALVYAPGRAADVLAAARPAAPWRKALNLSPPSPRIGHGIDLLDEALQAATSQSGELGPDGLSAFSDPAFTGVDGLDGLVRRVLVSTIEARLTRQPGRPLATAPWPPPPPEPLSSAESTPPVKEK